MKRDDFSKEMESAVFPEVECPRYSSCSVNSCPLDSEYPDRYSSPYDRERKCTLAKSIRVGIGAEYPGILRYQGMTKREYAAALAWNNLSIEDREKIIERGKKSLKALRSQTAEKVTV